MKRFNQKIKKLDFWDVQLVKLAAIAFTLFVLRIWSGAMNFINRVDWKLLLVIFVILCIRPFVRIWCKK